MPVELTLDTGTVTGTASSIVALDSMAGPPRHGAMQGENGASSSPPQLPQGMACEEGMELSAIIASMTAALAPCAIRAITINAPRKAPSNVRGQSRMSLV